MGLFKKEKPDKRALSVQTARKEDAVYSAIESALPLGSRECALYDALRGSVPIVDAAIDKIRRLVGRFDVECDDPRAQAQLDRFLRSVKVGYSGSGVHFFVDSYLDNLLTYGSAAGEIVLSPDGDDIAALYNVPLDNISVVRGKSDLSLQFMAIAPDGTAVPVRNPRLILFSALNPAPDEIKGRSLLSSLPFVTSVLLKIYDSIGQNFERVGNLRFAVTYKPDGSSVDKAYAKEIAQNIAKEWSGAMSSSKNGGVRDFVAVGDVDIRVIGADNQIIDSNVPVRQMLEQIIAKLGLPPFMLGLSWSTTERMSKQQADMLTSELEYYRRLLEPPVIRICELFLAMRGFSGGVGINWEVINMQDEIDIAQARLLNAQADNINAEVKKIETGADI